MSDLTRFLNASLSEADEAALFNEVYETLRHIARRRMAGEAPGNTLDTQGLVHEAWLRLEQEPAPPAWRDRRQYFAAAAEAMRRILIEKARRRLAAKRGGGEKPLPLDEVVVPAPVPDERLLAVDEALETLESENPLHAGIVKLRYFAGLRHAEIAGLLDLSETTVRRHWAVAKLRLYRQLEGNGK